MRRRLIYVILVLVLAMGWAAGTASADIKTALVGHWTLDEGSGSIAEDSSGNGTVGTLHGNPEWILGPLQGALSFDGDGDYVSTDKELLNDMSEFTLACWLNAANYNGDHVSIIGQNDCIELQFNGSNFRCWTAMGDLRIPYTFQYPSWHHVAATGGPEGMMLYIDGLPVLGPGATPGGGSYGTSIYKVNFAGGVSVPAGNWLNGQIDDIRIYNRALTDVDMQELFEWKGQEPSRGSASSVKGGIKSRRVAD